MKIEPDDLILDVDGAVRPYRDTVWFERSAARVAERAAKAASKTAERAAKAARKTAERAAKAASKEEWLAARTNAKAARRLLLADKIRITEVRLETMRRQLAALG